MADKVAKIGKCPGVLGTSNGLQMATWKAECKTEISRVSPIMGQAFNWENFQDFILQLPNLDSRTGARMEMSQAPGLTDVEMYEITLEELFDYDSTELKQLADRLKMKTTPGIKKTQLFYSVNQALDKFKETFIQTRGSMKKENSMKSEAVSKEEHSDEEIEVLSYGEKAVLQEKARRIVRMSELPSIFFEQIKGSLDKVCLRIVMRASSYDDLLMTSNFVGLINLVVLISLMGSENINDLDDEDALATAQETARKEIFSYKQGYNMHPTEYLTDFMYLQENCQLLKAPLSRRLLMTTYVENMTEMLAHMRSTWLSIIPGDTLDAVATFISRFQAHHMKANNITWSSTAPSAAPLKKGDRKKGFTNEILAQEKEEKIPTFTEIERYNNGDCHKYTRGTKGSCRFGNRCRFFHDEGQGVPAGAKSRNSANQRKNAVNVAKHSGDTCQYCGHPAHATTCVMQLFSEGMRNATTTHGVKKTESKISSKTEIDSDDEIAYTVTKKGFKIQFNPYHDSFSLNNYDNVPCDDQMYILHDNNGRIITRMTLQTTSLPDRHDIVINDTGASLILTGDSTKLSNFQQLKYPITISGVGQEESICTHIGDTIFGKTIFFPKCKGTILSFYDIYERGFEWKWNQENNCFSLHKGGYLIATFVGNPSTKLYEASWRQIMDDTKDIDPTLILARPLQFPGKFRASLSHPPPMNIIRDILLHADGSLDKIALFSERLIKVISSMNPVTLRHQESIRYDPKDHSVIKRKVSGDVPVATTVILPIHEMSKDYNNIEENGDEGNISKHCEQQGIPTKLNNDTQVADGQENHESVIPEIEVAQEHKHLSNTSTTFKSNSDKIRVNIDKAGKFAKAVNEPHPVKLKHMVRNSIINNCPITEKDIDNMIASNGPSRVRLQGKMLAPQNREGIKSPSSVPGNHLGFDIINIVSKGLYLFAADEATNFVKIIKLDKGKQATQLYDAVLKIFNFFRRLNWKVSTCFSDKEAVFLAVKKIIEADKTTTIEWGTSIPYEHNKWIERLVGIFRAAQRTVYHNQLYPILYSTEQHFARAVSNLLNITPNIKTGDMTTPYTVVMKKKPEFDDIKHTFGTPVVFYSPMEARNRPASTKAAVDTIGVLAPIDKGSKLASPGEVGVYLTVHEGGGHMVYDIRKDRCVHVRRVQEVKADRSLIQVMIERKSQQSTDYIDLIKSDDHDQDDDYHELPSTNDTIEVMENGEYTIESIIAHKGNPMKPVSMEFLTKLKGYSEPFWLSYKRIEGCQLVCIYILSIPALQSKMNVSVSTVDLSPLSNKIFLLLHERPEFDNRHSTSIAERCGEQYMIQNIITTIKDTVLQQETTLPRSQDGETNIFQCDEENNDVIDIPRLEYVRSFIPTALETPELPYESTKRENHTAVLAQILQYSVGKAKEKFGPDPVIAQLIKEFSNLVDHDCLSADPITADHIIIPGGVHIEEKIDALLRTADDLEVDLKCRITGGGNRQPDNPMIVTSSPTVSPVNVRIVLNVAGHEGYSLSTLDVKSAYLKCDIRNHISKYAIRLPKSVVPLFLEHHPKFKHLLRHDGSLILGLNKALYGLREAGRLWYEQVKGDLLSEGYKMSSHDNCVFQKGYGDNKLILCLHVDDFLIATNSPALKQQLISRLEKRYGLLKKKEGPDLPYLGMHIHHDEKTKIITLDAEAYISKLILQYPVEGLASTPATDDLFKESNDITLVDTTHYLSMVMSLMYLGKATRPDILLPVTYLAAQSSAPTKSDQHKLNRVMQFIKYTKSQKLRYDCQELKLYAHIDASHNVHKGSFGHAGCVVMMGKNGGNIYSNSSKIKLVSHSSTETELYALDKPIMNIMAMIYFMEELGYPTKPVIIFQDNKSTINMAKKGYDTGSNTKHVNLRYFYITERLKEGDIKIEYLPTEDMVADILTKPLMGKLFRDLRNLLLGYPITAENNIISQPHLDLILKFTYTVNKICGSSYV